MTIEKKHSRRSILKGGTLGVAATVPNMFYINHAWAQDVVYDGEVFDGRCHPECRGVGRRMEEFVRKGLTDQFEKISNCKLNWDNSFPWFPKFVTQGANDPVFDVANWNLPNLMQTNAAGDFFLTTEEIKANVPNAADCWDFAFASGAGVTWAYQPYVYAYRTDRGAPVSNFRDFFAERFVNKRGTYATENGLMRIFYGDSKGVRQRSV